ncbi:MAG: undecaprenyl/decaprenyl-phosphate alpha-N-acetylglucosaminyl 1-phosphate transferase, partial [Gammaproteobacteria bacterium]|nr:undecaprenyl/decaprenyl-phosphate alpha-N-acetylglucosaminyl 1-phosphate transferase [Gammaproteobacteria bacterium]
MITFEIRIILVFLTSLFAALYVLPRLSKIAKAIGLTDKPGDRKVHKEALPLVGGIGMTIAATFSSLLFVPILGLRGFFLGLAVLLFIGFLDDFKEVGPFQKFGAQIAATALLMYFSKTYLLSFGNLLGFGSIDIPNLTWVIWVITIFCVVGVVNAINLIDGLDGLAGGISFVAFLTFAAHASLADNHSIMLLNLAFAGAVLGFLRFNWTPARLFMGDAGSLCLGFTLAFMALILTQGEDASMRPVAALLILAVPITDTVTVMVKRILRGESPFKADQYHLHHIFIRSGMERIQAVQVIIGIGIIMSAMSILGTVYKLEDYYLFVVFAIYFIFYIFTSFYAVYLMRFSMKLRWKRDLDESVFNKSVGLITKGLDFFKVLRKSTRYNVDLDIVCH